MNKKILLLTALLIPIFVYADNLDQDSDESDAGVHAEQSHSDDEQGAALKAGEIPPFVKFNGGIKLDAFWDSRQTANLSDGETLLAPLHHVRDAKGHDLNNPAQFNMAILQSYLRATFFNPHVLHGTGSGMIWFDLSGIVPSGTNQDITTLAVVPRAAYYQIDWQQRSLACGMPITPLAPLECYPEVLSYSALPYDFFTPLGQGIVYTEKLGCNKKFEMIFHTEMSGPSSLQQGPLRDGLDFFGNSTTYQRNGLVPSMGLQFRWRGKKHYCGVGTHFRTFKPRIWTGAQGQGLADFAAGLPPFGRRVHERLNTGIAFAFLRYDFEHCALKLKTIYTQNAEVYGLLGGGYAIKSICPFGPGPENPCSPVQEEFAYANQKFKYTPMQGVVTWMDIEGKQEKWRPGFFAGFGINLGALSCLANPADVTFTRLCAPCVPNPTLLNACNPTASGQVVPDVMTNLVPATSLRSIIYSADPTLKWAVRVAPRIRLIYGPVVFGLEVQYDGASRGEPTAPGLTDNFNAKGKPIHTKVVSMGRVFLTTYYDF